MDIPVYIFSTVKKHKDDPSKRHEFVDLRIGACDYVHENGTNILV